MKLTCDVFLSNFEFWGGARENAETLTCAQLQQLESILEDVYPDGMSETELNDLMWFEFGTIKEWLGIDDEEPEEKEE